MIQKHFLVMMFIGFPLAAFGQGSTLAFPGEHHYQRSIIYLDDEQKSRIEANHLFINDDALTVTPRAGKNQTAPLQEQNFDLSGIYMIKTSKGTRAAEYAVYGGLIGGLSGLLAWGQAKAEAASDPFMETDDDLAKQLTIGFTVGGALIGGIVGAGKHKWETIYYQDKVATSPTKISLSLCCDRKSHGMFLNFTLYNF